MYLVLDLETVLDPTMPAPKDPNACKKCGSFLASCKHMGVPDDINDFQLGRTRFPVACGQPPDPPVPAPPYHQIVTIGYAHIGRDFSIYDLGVLHGHEAFILADLFAYMNSQERLTLVGFATRSFDGPVLAARGMRHALEWPWYYRGHRTATPRYRFDDMYHLDVMDFVTDYGAGKRASLNAWARLIGMPGKGETDGSGVAKLLEEGKLEDVKRYNAEDVIQTWAVTLRLMLLRGHVSRFDYQHGAHEVMRVIYENELLEGLRDRVEKRFLLEQDEDGNVL